jgi:hypothetical protein
MRRLYLFLCFFICLFQMIAQQQKTIIEELFYKKEGIYKTFEEFKFNSPSIPLVYGKAHKTKKYQASDQYGGWLDVFKLEVEKEEAKEIGNIWGFCDGRSIYVWTRSGGRFNNKYHFIKLDFFGRYCHYRMIYNQSTGGYDPITGLGGGSIKMAHTTCINMTNGAEFSLTKQNLKMILASDTALYNAFDNQKQKKNHLIRYLDMYSKKHREEVINPKKKKDKKDIALNSYLYKSDSTMTEKMYYDRLMKNGNNFLFVNKELRVSTYKNAQIKKVGVVAQHNQATNKTYYYKIGTWLRYYSNGQLKERTDYDLTEKVIRIITYDEEGNLVRDSLTE